MNINRQDRHNRHKYIETMTHGEVTNNHKLLRLTCLIAFSRLNMPKFGVFPLEIKVLKRAFTYTSSGTFGGKR